FLKPTIARRWRSPTSSACARCSPTATSASASSTGARASARAPHHRGANVPRDGHAVLRRMRSRPIHLTSNTGLKILVLPARRSIRRRRDARAASLLFHAVGPTLRSFAAKAGGIGRPQAPHELEGLLLDRIE